MHVADIVILLVLALPALVGVVYGFLNIAFSMLAWVVILSENKGTKKAPE